MIAPRPSDCDTHSIVPAPALERVVTRLDFRSCRRPILLHDATFLLFAVAIVVHLHLGIAAAHGTFGSMTRGVVSRPWAQLNHPRCYREVVKGDADGPGSS